MFEHIKTFIFALPTEECRLFYCELTGGDCFNSVNDGYKWHIYAKLRHCIRFHRYQGRVNKRTTEIVMNIMYWLDNMSDKYSISYKDWSDDGDTT